MVGGGNFEARGLRRVVFGFCSVLAGNCFEVSGESIAIVWRAIEKLSFRIL